MLITVLPEQVLAAQPETNPPVVNWVPSGLNMIIFKPRIALPAFAEVCALRARYCPAVPVNVIIMPRPDRLDAALVPIVAGFPLVGNVPVTGVESTNVTLPARAAVVCSTNTV